MKKIGVCTREQQNDSSLLDWMVGIGIQGYYQNDDVIMGEQLKASFNSKPVFISNKRSEDSYIGLAFFQEKVLKCA